MYTEQEVLDYVEQEDVKFIRLAFCDVFGIQKNISIMPSELRRAFADGISFDASAICGFADEEKSDLFLFPDPSTLAVLPWRPAHGRVIRLYCDIKHPDGSPFELDGRLILKKADAVARQAGIICRFGAEFEFYLFKTDENGEATTIPHDRAGYMDISPEDKGENVRREICLILEEMGIIPVSSHHEEGPGQHEIDFKYSDALSSADNAITFKNVVKTVAAQNGLAASFAAKPFSEHSGNGLHINISVQSKDKTDPTKAFMAGILKYICEMTAFLNTTKGSYERFGQKKAPKYITWSHENRSQLIRIPAAKGEYKRVELRSPDPGANMYIAYALLIYAGLDGVKNNMTPPEPLNVNLYRVPEEVTEALDTLPDSFSAAIETAGKSDFIRSIIPERVMAAYRLSSR